MKIYHFGKDMGQEIKAFDSKNLIITGMIDATDKIRMGCMHVDAGGIVGYHQASVSQLFAVVTGEGVVKGKEDKEYRIKAGYAAYWEEGEWHETRTEGTDRDCYRRSGVEYKDEGGRMAGTLWSELNLIRYLDHGGRLFFYIKGRANNIQDCHV